MLDKKIVLGKLRIDSQRRVIIPVRFRKKVDGKLFAVFFENKDVFSGSLVLHFSSESDIKNPDKTLNDMPLNVYEANTVDPKWRVNLPKWFCELVVGYVDVYWLNSEELLLSPG